MSYSDLFGAFFKIGCLSFGGPAAQIALMHKELVQDREWLTEAQYLRALSFCMLLPGPEAMQLATYAGWKLKGIPGGLIAGALFFLPGACVIAALALLYASFGQLSSVQAAFLGIQAAVVVIVIAALRKVASKALTGLPNYVIAICAFVALFVFQVPFPLVILAAGLTGAWLLPQTAASASLPFPPNSSLFGVVVVGGVLWALPIIFVWAAGLSFLTDVGLFFSKLAVVTFGGAYTVLAYMTQQVVGELNWLTTGEMMDALGLAETTPGPLILVTQFVAMVAGALDGGIDRAIAAGALTLWVTFVPCFIWIFAGAPFIDWLEGQARLQAALNGITASVVGVMANLSLWFALHVVFETLIAFEFGAVSILWPDWSSLRFETLSLVVGAAALMFWRGWELLPVLAFSASAALLWSIVAT